ncbi:MAG: hypothetical protein BroJett040_07680 [Oligoflexia bacterium]|nr:MAG: hypothetical protein BroJett040_07680 [Oligoflexia bacterium]
MKHLLITLVGLLMVAQSQAEGLRLGQPAYGGTGCPAGTASVSVSPDESAVSVLFDQFIAEAGRTTGRRIDRKSCNLTIPVQVPQGYSVAVFQVDYRGFNAVPRGGVNRFDSEYFWAGSRGPRLSRIFSGPTNDNFTVTDGLMASTLVWAPCGASVNLRVNASMMAQANAAMEQTIGAVDSADVSSGLVYHIQWRRCH